MINLDLPHLSALHFEEGRHRFTVRGRWVPSVSKVTRDWKPPFDSDKWSKIIADKRGISQADVLAEWAAKKKASIELGEAFHEAVEFHLTGRLLDGAMRAMDVPEASERFETWLQHVRPRFAEPALINGVTAVEAMVYHRSFMYAGFIDLLAETSLGLWVFDWKSNGEYNTENAYGDHMLPPFDDLPSCEHSEYSIQGCLLRMALESHGAEIAGSATAWLGPGGAVKLKVHTDLRSRIAEALRNARQGQANSAPTGNAAGQQASDGAA